MSPRKARLLAVTWSVALVHAACIIRDKEIDAELGYLNEGAVRILEPAPWVSPDLEEACNIAFDERVDAPNYSGGCPQPIAPLTYDLLANSQLCSCPDGFYDANAFEGQSYFLAEDPDLNDEGDGLDRIYAALVLDPPRSGRFPIAYRNYLDPSIPAQPDTRDYGELVDALGRPPPGVSKINIDDGSQRLDLCNNEDGRRIPQGDHVLRLIVSDRPFFAPSEVDANGMTVQLPTQAGVPDLARAATYDVANFKFRCDPPGTEGCECPELTSGG